MKSVIVLAHPEETSFNAQLARTAKKVLSADPLAQARLIDLYRIGFDPVESGRHFGNRQNPDRFDAQGEQRHAAETGTLPNDVERQLEAVEEADLLILQYPLWWYTPPAMLKGWFDRVFVYGRAYTSRRRYDTGFFRGKKAMLSVTTGALEATYQYNGRNGDIEHLLWPLNFTLYYLGFDVLEPFVAFGVEGGLKYSDTDVSASRLVAHMERFEEILHGLDARRSMSFNGWDDWDEQGRLKPGVCGYSPFMRARP